MERDFAHFIQEQRTAVGDLKNPSLSIVAPVNAPVCVRRARSQRGSPRWRRS